MKGRGYFRGFVRGGFGVVRVGFVRVRGGFGVVRVGRGIVRGVCGVRSVRVDFV